MDPVLFGFVIVTGSVMALAVIGMVVLEIRRVWRSPDSLARQAEELLAGRKFAEALNVANEYLRRTDPDDWQGLLLKAHALHELGERDEAWELIEQVRGMADKNLLMYGLTGVLLVQLGKSREAYEDLTRARDLEPDDPFLVLAWSQAATETGRLRLAIEVLEKHLEKHPDDDENQLTLGLTLREHGRHEDALERLGEAARRDPEDLYTLAYYARVLAENGDLAGARREINLGLSADPKHVDLLLADVDLTLMEGDAEAAIRKVTDLEPDWPGDHDILAGATADTLIRCGRFDETLRRTEHWTREHGLTRSAFSLRLHVFILRGEHDRVRREYDEAPLEVREDTLAMTEYARSLNNQGRHEQALEYLEKAADDVPFSDYAVFARAHTLQRLGRLQDARAGYERHREMIVSSVSALVGLAQLAQLQGDEPKAKDLAKQALQLAERLTDESRPGLLVSEHAYDAAFAWVLRYQLEGDEADAARAMQLLNVGLDTGAFGPEDLLMDPDLELFHEREDFKALLKKTGQHVRG